MSKPLQGGHLNVPDQSSVCSFAGGDRKNAANKSSLTPLFAGFIPDSFTTVEFASTIPLRTFVAKMTLLFCLCEHKMGMPSFYRDCGWDGVMLKIFSVQNVENEIFWSDCLLFINNR